MLFQQELESLKGEEAEIKREEGKVEEEGEEEEVSVGAPAVILSQKSRLADSLAGVTARHLQQSRLISAPETRRRRRQAAHQIHIGAGGNLI